MVSSRRIGQTTVFQRRKFERLHELKLDENRFLTYLGTPIGDSAKNRILVDLLNVLELESYQTAFLSGNFGNLVVIQQLSIATIRFSEKGDIAYDESGWLSDYQISSLDDLNAVINKTNGGYFSEVSALIYGNSCRPGFHYGHVVIIERAHQVGCDIVSGGRYFSTKDVRHLYHQLSLRILRNKRPDTRQDDVFRGIFESLIELVDGNIQRVDAITRIPPRLSESDDRFLGLIENLCAEKKRFENLALELVCIKDFSEQKFLSTLARKRNVAGAFQAGSGFVGKHVVLIDDVITTGSTAFEAARTIYGIGAQKVTIVVLGINQRNIEIRNFSDVPLVCDCGEEFQMRFNRANKLAFFGCKGYPDCLNTLSYEQAIIRHNIENRIAVADDDHDNSDLLF